jgi:hypothetical protein
MSKTKYYMKVWKAAEILGWNNEQLYGFLQENKYKNPTMVIQKLYKELYNGYGCIGDQPQD